MSSSVSRGITYCILLSLILVVAVGSVGANSGFEIEMDDEIETPEQTVDRELIGEHTISSVGITEADGSISVDVRTPETNSSPQIELRAATDPIRLEDFRNLDPNATHETVSLGVSDPGSYILAVTYNDTTQAILPVVVTGYAIDAAYEERSNGDELTVEATVSPTESEGAPHEVEAVVWNDNTSINETLTHQSGDEYETTVSLSEFDDSYQVYVAALGEETVETTGENDILGISDARDGLDSTNGDDTGSDSDSHDGGSDAFNDGDDESDDTEADADDQDDQDVSDEPTNDTETDDLDSNDTDSAVDDDESSVIEPTDTNTSGNDASENAGAGTDETNDDSPLSPVLALVGIIAFGLGLSRQQ